MGYRSYTPLPEDDYLARMAQADPAERRHSADDRDDEVNRCVEANWPLRFIQLFTLAPGATMLEFNFQRDQLGGAR